MNNFVSVILSSVTFWSFTDWYWLKIFWYGLFSSVKDLSLILEKLSWWWKFCGWYWTSLMLEYVVIILNAYDPFNELVVKWLMVILEWVSSILISFKRNWYKKSKLRFVRWFIFFDGEWLLCCVFENWSNSGMNFWFMRTYFKTLPCWFGCYSVYLKVILDSVSCASYGNVIHIGVIRFWNCC